MEEKEGWKREEEVEGEKMEKEEDIGRKEKEGNGRREEEEQGIGRKERRGKWKERRGGVGYWKEGAKREMEGGR